MNEPIVADTGPLIGLARSSDLDILPQLYQTVLIPKAVHDELQIGSSRPGAMVLARALKTGWLRPSPLKSKYLRTRDDLCIGLGLGESEAICLAEQDKSRFLHMDDRGGRAMAKRRGIKVVGTGAILLAAKREGLIPSILTALKGLSDVGYASRIYANPVFL